MEINPDGYSHTHINDRVWRKNRATNPNTVCVGVDLNRQYPAGLLTSGGSSNPCSATYASTEPLNQAETIAWDTCWFLPKGIIFRVVRKVRSRRKLYDQKLKVYDHFAESIPSNITIRESSLTEKYTISG